MISERNMYLYGFTLFLSLILSRTYSLVLDLIKAQEDLVIAQAKVASILLSLQIITFRELNQRCT